MQTVKINTEHNDQRSKSFLRCRPHSTTRFEIEACITRPDFQLEVRNYGWTEPMPPALFEPDVCYLELTLSQKKILSEVNYLDSSHPDAFVATGNCAFMPAGGKALMRSQRGEVRAVGCLFEKSVFSPYQDWEWTPLEMAACFNINNTNIRTALVQLSLEALNPGYRSEALVDTLFHYILVELSRHIRASQHINIKPFGLLSTRKLNFIKKHIENSAGKIPTVSFMAQKCGVSSRHLARLFKTTTGKTITEYIQEVRIKKAQSQLIGSSDSLKVIACNCGFHNQSAFSHTFKKSTGLTPSQYRNGTSH